MGTAVATVNLQPDMAEQIAHLAGREQSNTDAFVDQALRAYLAHLRREKIRREMDAFREQHAELLEHFAGKYIAMHDGQVIDHDMDQRALHLRIFARLGHTPVLLKRVDHEPERDLIFRSPRFERGAP
jgi:hypothetical protein